MFNFVAVYAYPFIHILLYMLRLRFLGYIVHCHKDKRNIIKNRGCMVLSFFISIIHLFDPPSMDTIGKSFHPLSNVSHSNGTRAVFLVKYG